MWCQKAREIIQWANMHCHRSEGDIHSPPAYCWMETTSKHFALQKRVGLKKKKKSGREEIFVCLTQIIYFSYCNVSYFGDTDTVFAHAASHGHPNCTFGLKAFTSTAKHLLGDSVRALQLHLLYKPELRACANKHCCNVTRPCSKCILTNSCSSPSL